jgi:cytochrome c peroxidase
MNRALGTAVGLSLAVWVGCRLDASSTSSPEIARTLGSPQFLSELHTDDEPGRVGRATSPRAPMRERGARRSDRPTEERPRFMESSQFLSELHTAHEPGRAGRARSPSAPIREYGAPGGVALPREFQRFPGRRNDRPPEMQFEALPWRAPDPADNPSTAGKVELGRLLFFDPILSSTKDVACATCHHPGFGWGDGRSTPVGVGGAGLGPLRTFQGVASLPVLTFNAPSLLNVGFNGLVAGRSLDPGAAPMFWDARVQGLERQALAPIRMLGEMRDEGCAEGEAVPGAVRRVQAIAEYRARFREVFGGEAEKVVTAEHLAQAIAAFERTLVTPDTPFDRFLRGEVGAMNPDQKRGLEVFQSAGCAECHGGPMFSDFQRHWIGVVDGTPSGNRAFRTPTLRNLRRTAPYMHHGSLRTIRDVLLFYEELGDAVSETLDGGDAAAQPRLDPLLRKLHLDPSDFNFLEAFLEALDGSEGLQVVPATVPSGLTIPSSP